MEAFSFITKERLSLLEKRRDAASSRHWAGSTGPRGAAPGSGDAAGGKREICCLLTNSSEGFPRRKRKRDEGEEEGDRTGTKNWLWGWE